MEAAIANDLGGYDARLAANDRSLRAAGHWGVPTMVFKGEAFFGQDRFDVLMWRLRQNGLQPKY
jgi:2-hydroxychromene-2-carboxylate isomerase